MSYYGVIFPEFWTGRTGRDLRQRGGKDAQILALYLISNRHANMLGLYRLLVDDVRHETALGRQALVRALMAIDATTYARYDEGSSYVWVRHMARFRLGLKPGEFMDPSDNRVTAINRLYHAIDDNPFLGAFFDANHKTLRLHKRREGSPPSTARVPEPPDPKEKPLTKPLVSQVQRSGTGTGIRDQVQERTPRLASRPASPSNGVPKTVIRALARSVIADHPGLSFVDLKDLAKEACAKHRLLYDAELVGSALEQALAQITKQAVGR